MTLNKTSPLPLGEDLGEGKKGRGEGATSSPLPQGEDLGEGNNNFTPGQLAWLNKIKDDAQGNANVVAGKEKVRPGVEKLAWATPGTTQIAQNAEMTVDDFNYIPFNQACLPARQEGLPAPKRQVGGLLKARELFGKDLDKLIQELNGYLIA